MEESDMDVEFEDVRSTFNYSDDYLNNIDTSQFPFPNVLWNTKPLAEVVVKATFMIIIGVAGIIFNSIILIILVKNRWLWTASNYLVGNLALVDFLTLLLCPWFMLVRDFYQNYVLRYFGCRFEGFMQASLLLATVGAVLLVSYDRLAAAALTSEARVTKTVAPKLIIISWLAAIVLSVPWIVKREYMERIWLDHVEMFCVEDVVILGIYWHFTLIFLVWIPLSVMVLTYGAIMWRLEKSREKLAACGAGQAISKARVRAIRITALVLATSVVCRLPYTILVYWRNRLSMEINSAAGSYGAMWFAANYLMYLNSAINPLIYGFTNTRFRRAMDRTPGVACWKFGSWCCVFPLKKKKQVHAEKNTEKIFVIEHTPAPNKKLTNVIKHLLHINKDTLELSVPKVDEATTKPTRLTFIKNEL